MMRRNKSVCVSDTSKQNDEDDKKWHANGWCDTVDDDDS